MTAPAVEWEEWESTRRGWEYANSVGQFRWEDGEDDGESGDSVEDEYEGKGDEEDDEEGGVRSDRGGRGERW